MKMEIKVPAMGESISEATIGTIFKISGGLIAADDELLELETDKVNQALYAPQAGVVIWNVKNGDVVKIGQVIGYIDADSRAVSNSPMTPSVTSAKEGPEASLSQLEIAEPSKDKSESSQVSQPETQIISEKRANEIIPSKGARESKQSYIAEISSVKSSAELIEKAPSALPTMPSKNEKKENRQKMSKVRKVIAARLVEVQHQTAMLSTFNEVDMTQIMALRESYKELFTKKYQARLGLMSFFIKACVSALKVFPDVNAYIDGDEIVYREYFDIGVAVGTERGLFVPVVRNCDTLSFAGIERSIEEFAKKAREGKLSVNDLQGGCFTITNGGVYGSLLSTPILNPPQSAILGMHKIMKRPVVNDDAVVIRQMMYLALSYDHRIIDGKIAVSFLVHIKGMLEDPSRLLLEI